MSIRCNPQRATPARKSIQTKNKLMPRSLTKAKRRELQKVTRRAADAKKRVEALQSQKRATQEEVRRLRSHLGARKCAEKFGPCRTLLLKSPPDKCEDINISKFKLQVIIDEFAEAQASLESILRVRDYLKN